MLMQLLSGAPKWVFAVFFVLLWYGWMQSRTRQAGRAKVLMLPIIMTLLSIGGVFSSFGPKLPALLAWVGGFAAAAVLNQVLRAPRGVSFDRTTRRFQLPGSWTPLVLMMIIYFAKYTVGAAIVLNPELVATTGFAVLLSLIFGAVSGTFFARFLIIWSTSLSGGAGRRAGASASLEPTA